MTTLKERFENGNKIDDWKHPFYIDDLDMHVMHDSTEYYKWVNSRVVRVYLEKKEISNDYEFWSTYVIYTLVEDKNGRRIHATYGYAEPECSIVD